MADNDNPQLPLTPPPGDGSGRPGEDRPEPDGTPGPHRRHATAFRPGAPTAALRVRSYLHYAVSIAGAPADFSRPRVISAARAGYPPHRVDTRHSGTDRLDEAQPGRFLDQVVAP